MDQIKLLIKNMTDEMTPEDAMGFIMDLSDHLFELEMYLSQSIEDMEDELDYEDSLETYDADPAG